MTSVNELIAQLEEMPKDALVFTNQYGGDFSEEHSKEIVLELYKNAYYHLDSDSYIRGDNYYLTQIDLKSYERKDVVRIVC
ncbi:hypothetical protein LCGC14_1961280 [marine sediment metagenome]|uniref:Uncharacterized protein n=1 Tax=marine sediment metagenome TaxID=412755 RepID=A0A0F9FER7_9ZZZZ